MKKVFIGFILSFIFCSPVFAEEYNFVNYYGVELTLNEFNYLSNYFDYDTLYYMNENVLEDIKDSTNLNFVKEEKYVVVDTYYDNLGNVVNSIEREVDFETAYAMLNENVMTRASSVTHQTSIKKITLRIFSESGTRYVSLVNEWLSIPSVKSVDLIGVRIMSKKNSTALIQSFSYGKQIWDGNVIDYDICGLTSCGNTVIDESSTYLGVGVSMNIKDDVEDTLRNELMVGVSTSSSYLIAVGTYQHATSSISVANSKKYSFSASGLGDVFYFSNSTLSNKYDNTAGLNARLDF